MFPSAPVNPDTIDTFSYLGCFTSGTDFSTFVAGEDTQEMTLERCVESCSTAGHTYAGIFGSQCYCADDLDAGSTRAIEDETRCSTPCPGNSTEFCGGGDSSARLFTVYAGVADEEKPLAVPMAGMPSMVTVVVCPTDTAMPTPVVDNVETKLVLPVPAETPRANETFLQPVPPPVETPTAAGVVSLPDWKLGALSSVMVIGLLMLV